MQRVGIYEALFFMDEALTSESDPDFSPDSSSFLPFSSRWYTSSTSSGMISQKVAHAIPRPVIKYIVNCVSETVEYAMDHPTFSHHRGRPLTPLTRSRHNAFASLVSTVLFRAKVAAPTVLVALIYVARARPHLSIALAQWALERVFLGALIVASKYTQDLTLKNVHWAMCTGVFGKRDIGRIEREFLQVLDWDLRVRTAELMTHQERLMAEVEAEELHRHHHKSTSTSTLALTYIPPPRRSRQRPRAFVREISPSSSPYPDEVTASACLLAHPPSLSETP
ncbi:hypothetical protein B0H11DRAFT_2226919 [Mycena galericulata]|nr:hypothetical protein B0H11DRAFT_2226919 [Mycena galericulata]